MNPVVVVGGGISGILSALLLREKFDDVYLIEKEPKLGGLLSSEYSPAGDSFDYGTHYLVDTGHEKIDSLLFPEEWRRDWIPLPYLKAGNYFQGKLNEHSMFPDTNLLPREVYQRGVEELLALKEEAGATGNLEDFLNGTFGKTFTKAVFEPILTARLGLPLSELYANGHILINLTRILAFDAEKTRELKRRLPAYDQKIGFHSYLEGVRSTQSYYPSVGGTGAWIDLLEGRMAEAGVKVLKGVAIKSIAHSGGRVSGITFHNGASMACGAIHWTLPVSAFLKLCQLPTIVDPPKIRTTSHFHFVFDQPPITELYYFLCHDASKLSYRITLYSNIQRALAEQRGRYCVSVEVLSGPLPDIEGAARQILSELVEMGALSGTARVLWSSARSGVSGIPVITPKFVSQTQQQMREIEGKIENAQFSGMVPGASFFKKEVLLHSYAQIAGLTGELRHNNG